MAAATVAIAGGAHHSCSFPVADLMTAVGAVAVVVVDFEPMWMSSSSLSDSERRTKMMMMKMMRSIGLMMPTWTSTIVTLD